jgi:hypothetical protein
MGQVQLFPSLPNQTASVVIMSWRQILPSLGRPSGGQHPPTHLSPPLTPPTPPSLHPTPYPPHPSIPPPHPLPPPPLHPSTPPLTCQPHTLVFQRSGTEQANLSHSVQTLDPGSDLRMTKKKRDRQTDRQADRQTEEGLVCSGSGSAGGKVLIDR